MLRRLIVIQGDTEPASVEQQRHLGKTAPSLYDMRNLFQVNVEEGRHLWAMVYLLQKYFGKDGREEAEGLLQRRSGDADKPRMLGAFNEATPDWLSFFMFTYFTDRDGKMQLESLAQSGFDPLSRTCRFMLTEEAHHMFVGETGVGRAIERTCQAMKEAGIEDPYDISAVRKLGVIDLPTMQKKANLHFTLSLDLFGSEVSTNAANYYNCGLKGRFQETRLEDDHQLSQRDLCGEQADRRPGQDGRRAGADGHQHAPARRLRGRLRQGRGALEQGDREGRHQVPAQAAARRLPSPHRRVRQRQGSPPGRGHQRGGMGQAEGPVAALQGRRRLHREPDGALLGARQVRLLDLGPQGRHRQQGRRLRVREDPRDPLRVRKNDAPGRSHERARTFKKQHLIDPEICIRCNTCEATCPVGAITHDDRNYVVDADVCNYCMACIAPCPTGSIDNWRIVATPYPLDEQFAWSELPRSRKISKAATRSEGG